MPLQIIKAANFENRTKELLDVRIRTLITDRKIMNKINRNADSYYVNGKESDTESLNLQSAFPIIPGRTVFIPISRTETR